MLLAWLVLPACRSQPAPGPKDGIHVFEMYSQPFQLDGRYTSMAGPSEDKLVNLVEQERELLWIVGYEAELLEGDSEQEVPARFMCHASLDLRSEHYKATMAPRVMSADRLFTLSQGVTAVEFPAGFGIPIPSDQLLFVRTQVLNLNAEPREGQVRFRIRLRYRKQSELSEPMKALFLVRAPVVKALDPEASHFGGVVSEAGCAVGVNANPEDYLEVDSQGQKFIPHWKISPGRETTKTLITERLNLPADLRVHTIVTHVHPTAESLTLIDLTTMESIYRANVDSSNQGQLEITKIDSYASPEGLLLKKDHQYGLVSVYDNQSGRDLDSMAVMYLYIHDPEYRPPTEFELQTPLPPDTHVLTRTEQEITFKSKTSFALALPFFQGMGEQWARVHSEPQSAEWTSKDGRLILETTDEGTLIRLLPTSTR